MRKFQVGFYHDQRSGNFIVTLLTGGTQRQQLVAQPKFFIRVTGVLQDVLAGVVELSAVELVKLGFIVTEEGNRDDNALLIERPIAV